jgi:hypothetical protein
MPSSRRPRPCYDATMRTLCVAVAIVVAILVAGPALGADLASCRAVKGATARLNCYDGLPIPPAIGQDTSNDPAPFWTLTGQGTMTTRPFNAEDGWELQWDAKGSFGVMVKTAPDGGLVTAATSNGAGRTYVGDGGTFTIEVLPDGNGSWALRAVRVPP